MDILDILGRIGFDPKVALFNTVNFLVALLILKQFVFGRITKALEERQKVIQKSLEDAEMYKSELAMAENKAKDIISSAQSEATQIVHKSHENSEKIINDAKLDAEKEVEGIKKKADQDIEAKRVDMVSKFKKEAADLAVQATEKIIKTKVDKDEDRKLIESFLKTI